MKRNTKLNMGKVVLLIQLIFVDVNVVFVVNQERAKGKKSCKNP
jgi:hypothetical protein